LIRSGGGCCDCGDPEAWKESGFCTKHARKPPNSQQPSELPATFISFLQSTVDAVLNAWTIRDPIFLEYFRLCTVLDKAAKHHTPGHNIDEIAHGAWHSAVIGKLIQYRAQQRQYQAWFESVISWLATLCQMHGDVAKQVIGEAMVKPVALAPSITIAIEHVPTSRLSPPPSLISLLISLDGVFQASLLGKLYSLLHLLIGNYAFKYEFSICYAKQFSEMVCEHFSLSLSLTGLVG
jgi:hypothetical protein